MRWQPPGRPDRFLLPDDVAFQAQVLALEGDVETIPLGEGELRHWLWVLKIGRGPLQVAVVANAHADEPAGTVSAIALAHGLAESVHWRAVLDRVTFHILPTVNPRGLQRNTGWLLSSTPSLSDYFLYSRRDPPAEDREFGYGATPAEAAHPECAAWHAYLDALPALDGYVSLHSMSFAGGALFLGQFDQPERWRTLRQSMVDWVVQEAGHDLHDEDRGGRKGFHYLGPGWWTTPTREEMSAFLSQGGQAGAADWLRLNSMQVARQRHNTPVALVTELPLWSAPELTDPAETEHLRAEVDLSAGQRLEATVAELELLGEPAHEEAGHRLAQARGLVAQAESWGDRRANAGYRALSTCGALRAQVANAALALRLDRELGRRPNPIWVQRFRERLAAFENRFHWRAWSLDEQVDAQLVLVEILAEQLIRERG